MISLQLIIFLWISLSFIICLGWVVGPMACEAIRDILRALRELIRKPERHEAVILQFRPRSRKGHFHG